MSESFKCPSCGAPLDYAGGEETTVRCPYCHNVVGVPAELRPTPAPATPPPANAAPTPPPAGQTATPPVSAAPAPPATRAELHEQLHEMRRTAREQRRALRQAAREQRRRGGG